MQEIAINNQTVKTMGRTFWDEGTGALYFNYTCSGISFIFTGTKVEAELITDAVNVTVENNRAWLAVFLNDEETPYRRFPLDKESGRYTLYESDKPAAVQITLRKLTEAQMGRSGIRALYIEGEPTVTPAEDQPLKLEFIGDSITCGYGNEAGCAEDGFRTPQENGWLAFAALAARRLHADFHCVSFSGIGVLSSYTPSNVRNDSRLMPELYPYTDLLMEEVLHKDKPQKWDFSRFVPDIIVVNLGTNDASYVQYEEKSRFTQFGDLYLQFLREIRKANPQSFILCTLGPLESRLFPAIQKEVGQLTVETGDHRLSTLLFDPQQESDGVGGSWHPSLKTHQKMAAKLIAKLEEIVSKTK